VGFIWHRRRNLMKIAFLHQPWNQIVPGKPQGSVPIWTSQVAQRMSREHDVYIYSRRFDKTLDSEGYGNQRYIRVSSPIDEWVSRFVLPLISLGDRQRPSMSSTLYFRQYYSRAAKDMASKGVEVVHVHSFPQAASIIRSFHPSVKIVIHLHVEWLNLLPPSVAQRQIQDADLVLGCSDYVSSRIRQSFPAYSAKIRTLHNAVDVDLFKRKQCGDAQPDRERRILLVGRISPEKGIHILLKVFQRLLEEEYNLRLEIIGPEALAPKEVIINMSESEVVSRLRLFYDTTVWARLRTRLRNRYPRRFWWLQDTTYGGALRALVKGKMADRVRFIGFIPNEDLPCWYRKADLVVLPSVYETFGIPLIEAMASGTPVLATRVGGIPEIVEDGRVGILVEPGSVEQLADGIRNLIRDDKRLFQMGEEARQMVIDKFSWDKAVTTLLQYYREILLTPAEPLTSR